VSGPEPPELQPQVVAGSGIQHDTQFAHDLYYRLEAKLDDEPYSSLTVENMSLGPNSDFARVIGKIIIHDAFLY